MRTGPISRILLLVALQIIVSTTLTNGQVPPPQSADYTVVFNASWSVETQPIDHPSNAHFSGLVGGTHNQQVTFWMVGGTATQGIEIMAETGSKTVLIEEVEAAITDGTAGQVISGGSISSSPGIAAASVTVTQEFPLATVVSMIAPSPDWFVGVSGLNLFVNGDWIDKRTITLLPYDAGTDSGTSFTSPDQQTIPQVAISVISEIPFPNTEPLGIFTFWLNPPHSPIFADGFESGQTSVWSSTQ